MANMRDLSFATFNLFNLQVPGGLTYSDTPPYPDSDEGRAAYDRKIDWAAGAVRILDAEVIGFQELWAAQALVDVFTRAELLEQYDLVARDAPGPGRPQVALAVRKGRNGQSQVLPGAHWVANFPEDFRFEQLRETEGSKEEITLTINEFSRPVLRAEIQAEGTRPTPPVVTCFVAHLKSKGPARLSFARPLPVALETYPAITRSAVAHIRRIMEAGALRALLDEVMASEAADALSPTVVIGDLNDASLAVSTDLITNQPTYRLIQKGRAGERSDKGLYTVEQLQQYRSLRHVYYSHVFKNKRESLDHILVSEEFYDHSRKRNWSFREMEVYNDHLNRESFEAEGATDHGLVRALFDWNPMPAEIDVP